MTDIFDKLPSADKFNEPWHHGSMEEIENEREHLHNYLESKKKIVEAINEYCSNHPPHPHKRGLTICLNYLTPDQQAVIRGELLRKGFWPSEMGYGASNSTLIYIHRVHMNGVYRYI
jgi:hypothetical protein